MQRGEHHPVTPSLTRVRTAGGSVVGAAFLIGDGTVCTCAHVVTSALGGGGTGERPAGRVRLDFPFLRQARAEAEIEAWGPATAGNDIAVLRLTAPPPPGSHPAPLLPSTRLVGRRFEVYGFPEGNDAGGWAAGELGYRRADGSVQIEGTKVTGYRIQPGFSGAPVWAPDGPGVVGMVVATERDTASKVAFLIPNASIREVYPDFPAYASPLPAGLQSLSVGVSSQYVETRLGIPRVERRTDSGEFLEVVYPLPECYIQIIYDGAGRVGFYAITSRDPSYRPQLPILGGALVWISQFKDGR